MRYDLAMAKRIRTPAQTGQRAPHIHWGQWADGDWRRLVQGEDFLQSPALALRAARTWGWRNGCEVSGTLADHAIDVRITPRGTNTE